MRMAICMLVYATGVVVMMVSDAQKHFVLGLKRGLITDGMFAKIRHPNYTGEMMVYGAFAGMVDHWLPWAVLAFVWILVFGSNIAGKEASMSRYPEWAEYKSRTKYLIPWVF